MGKSHQNFIGNEAEFLPLRTQKEISEEILHYLLISLNICFGCSEEQSHWDIPMIIHNYFWEIR